MPVEDPLGPAPSPASLPTSRAPSTSPPPSATSRNPPAVSQDQTRWIILPICIPGDYSSNVIAAITRLFGFARVVSSAECTDSDLFESTIIETLDDNPVVVADRPNHLIRHRACFRGHVLGGRLMPSLLALNWDISCLPVSEICSICLNGQTPRDPAAKAAVLRYLEEYEPLQLEEFDSCVYLNPLDDFVTTLRSAAAVIAKKLKIEMPACLRFLDSPPLRSLPRGDTLNPLLPARRLDRHRVIIRPDVASTAAAGVSGHIAYVYPGLRPGSVEVYSVLEATALVNSMRQCSEVHARPVAVKSAQHVTRWEVAKKAFYDIPLRIPTLARALWTLSVSPTTQNDLDGIHRIALRGYDKIFDINETPWSTWRSMAHYLTGPFHVTAKLNGSLIMIAALTPAQLLVTSRHLASAQGVDNPENALHADVGESRLQKQIRSAGKTSEELAALLWHHNWTLMCELLDDDFEERVMPVAPSRPGLYLHGINDCTVSFSSKSPRFVTEFAATWGFLPVPYETCSTLDDVQTLVNDHATAETWHGMHVEGIVVRATVGSAVTQGWNKLDVPPYPPPCPAGHPFFFKVYFSRYQFGHVIRMITLSVISGQVITPSHPLSKKFLERSEFKAFERWIKAQIASRAILLDPRKRRGFVSIRKRFLSWFYTAEGQAQWNDAFREVVELRELALEATTPLTHVEYGAEYKWLVLFLGLPGCGKTSIARALSILYDFRHVECGARGTTSAKIARHRFLSSIAPEYKRNRIVMADGYCHRKQRRTKLCAATWRAYPEPRVLVFQWQMPVSDAVMARRVALQRLVQHTPETPPCVVDGVLEQFAAEYESLENDEADIIIPMRYDEDLEASVNRAVQGIATRLGIRPPSQHAISDAVRIVGADVKTPYTVGRIPRVKSLVIRYYAFLPELDVSALLESIASACNTPIWSSVWIDTLVPLPLSEGLVYTQPRVTLIHPKSTILPPSEAEALALRCASLPPSALFQLSLDKIVFNHRILIATVRSISAVAGMDSASAAAADYLVSTIPGVLMGHLHIVLARCNLSVSPAEAVALLQNLKGSKRAESFPLDEGRQIVARLQGFSVS